MNSWFGSRKSEFEREVAEVAADSKDRLTPSMILRELDGVLGLTDDETEMLEAAGVSPTQAGFEETELLTFGAVREPALGECLDGAELSQYLATGQLPGDRKSHLGSCPMCESLVACARTNIDRAEAFAMHLASPIERQEVSQHETMRALRDRQWSAVRANLESGKRFEELKVPAPEQDWAFPQVPVGPVKDWAQGALKPTKWVPMAASFVLGMVFMGAFVSRYGLSTGPLASPTNPSEQANAWKTEPLLPGMSPSEDRPGSISSQLASRTDPLAPKKTDDYALVVSASPKNVGKYTSGRISHDSTTIDPMSNQWNAMMIGHVSSEVVTLGTPPAQFEESQETDFGDIVEGIFYGFGRLAAVKLDLTGDVVDATLNSPWTRRGSVSRQYAVARPVIDEPNESAPVDDGAREAAAPPSAAH